MNEYSHVRMEQKQNYVIEFVKCHLHSVAFRREYQIYFGAELKLYFNLNGQSSRGSFVYTFIWASNMG